MGTGYHSGLSDMARVFLRIFLVFVGIVVLFIGIVLTVVYLSILFKFRSCRDGPDRYAGLPALCAH